MSQYARPRAGIAEGSLIDPAARFRQLSEPFRSLSPQFLIVSVAPLSAQLLFWAAVFASLVAHVVIVRSVLRASARRFTELAWAVLPAIVLAVVFVVTWRNMHVNV